MSNQFLTFTLQSHLYAVDATAVMEMHYLPGLTFIEEAPPFIAGVYNLRGRIVPAIDLHILFGHPQEKYSLSDGIIVLESGGLLTGLIVNDVQDVIIIESRDIEPIRIPYHKHHAAGFISGEAKAGGDIVMILDHHKLLENETAEEPPDAGSGISNPKFDGLTPEEKRIFHERAINLMQHVVSEDLTGSMPSAVINLNGEFFAVELEFVREFADLRGLAPVPCCPEHIIGNMNLRGNILTLLDIRGMLNLPSGKISETAKVVVAGIENMLVGITVDDVLDVVYLRPSDISHVPSAIPAVREEYLRGNAPYSGRMMTLLDLARLLMSDKLIVNEEI